MRSTIVPPGWNTWDVRHVNAMAHLPSGLRVRLALQNAQTGEVRREFDWRTGLARLGPHATDGSFCEIALRWENAVVVCAWATDGDRLACRIVPERGCERLHVILEMEGSSGVGLPMGWEVRFDHPPVSAPSPAHTFTFDEPLLVAVAPAEQAFGAEDAATLLSRRAAEHAQTTLRSEGWLADAAEGLTRAIAWNTIWEPIKGRICTPVSRDWCKGDFFGSYVLFDWDTFFCALMIAWEDPALAAANVRAILQEVTPQGFVPNFGCEFGPSEDRSQPPVGAYCVLKLYRGASLTGRPEDPNHPLGRSFLQETFPILLRWHEWWLPHRDGNGDGLLEWGSDPVAAPRDWQAHNLQAAMYESGLDNSPMYDDVAFNPQTNTMELADVGLNALYALDAWALSEIAQELGLFDEANRLRSEHDALGRRINQVLWNEEAGIYCNRHWDGRFSLRLSPTLFYPMLAGIVPPPRAERMVREHLLNEREFWGRFVIPSIARNDPGYGDNHYWRGRIWPPMNFLVYEGLRRCGFRDVAHAFARHSLDLFLGEWQAESHVHENYNADTGDGDDSRWSDPVYTWGALLAYVALQELAAVEPWPAANGGGPGWRFAPVAQFEPAALRHIRVAEGLLDVTAGPDGVRVTLNGAPY